MIPRGSGVLVFNTPWSNAMIFWLMVLQVFISILSTGRTLPGQSSTASAYRVIGIYRLRAFDRIIESVALSELRMLVRVTRTVYGIREDLRRLDGVGTITMC